MGQIQTCLYFKTAGLGGYGFFKKNGSREESEVAGFFVFSQ